MNGLLSDCFPKRFDLSLYVKNEVERIDLAATFHGQLALDTNNRSLTFSSKALKSIPHIAIGFP